MYFGKVCSIWSSLEAGNIACMKLPLSILAEKLYGILWIELRADQGHKMGETSIITVGLHGHVFCNPRRSDRFRHWLLSKACSRLGTSMRITLAVGKSQIMHSIAHRVPANGRACQDVMQVWSMTSLPWVCSRV